MPTAAVYVGRPSRWGNPYSVLDYSHAEAAHLFATYFQHLPAQEQEALLAPLRGKHLICWCAPTQPCHADVLLYLANQRETTMRQGMQCYATLNDLCWAFTSGALSRTRDRLVIDNDSSHLSVDGEVVYEGPGPDLLAREACTLLGIPWENA